MVRYATDREPNLEDLVERYILRNWEAQDEPEHLRTIRDRLLRNDQQALQLLGQYQRIREREEGISIYKIKEYWLLRLSGIVVQKNNDLVVYNPIYRRIFNADWIEEQLSQLRPYAKTLEDWLHSQRSPEYLLPEKALEKALKWAEGRKLSAVDYEYISASQGQFLQQQLTKAKKRANQLLSWGGIIGLGIIIGSVFIAQKQVQRIKDGARLTQNGDRLLSNFKAQELDTLVSALEQGKQLQGMVKPRSSLRDYPSLTPLTNLNYMLANIREIDRLKISESFPPPKIVLSSNAETIAILENGDTISIRSRANNWQPLSLPVSEKVNDVMLSPDGREIAILSDNNLSLGSVAPKPEILASFPKADKVAFNAQNTQLALADYNQGKLWLQDKQTQQRKLLAEILDRFTSLKFSPDGQWLAVGTDKGQVNLYSTKSQKLVKAIEQAHPSEVTDISFSPDNQTFVSADNQGNIKLRQRGGSLIWSFSAGDKGAINCIYFLSPTQIISAGDDKTIKVWGKDGKLHATYQGHNNPIENLGVTPDNQQLISLANDGEMRTWLLPKVPRTAKKFNLDRVDFAPSILVAENAADPGKILLSRLDGTQLATPVTWKDITAASFSPDGKTLALASLGVVTRYNLNGEEINRFESKASQVWSLSFSPNGKLLAMGKDTGKVELHSLEKKSFKILESKDQDWITSVTFSPDGQLIAGGDKRGNLNIWKIDGTLVNRSQEHREAITALKFSPNGQLLVSASRDGSLKLWNNGGKLLQNLLGHQLAVKSVDFQQDGTIFASGGEDGTIRFWSHRGDFLSSLPASESAIAGLNFSEDGSTLTSVDAEAEVQQWKLSIPDLVGNGCKHLKNYLEKNLPQVCQESLRLE